MWFKENKYYNKFLNDQLVINTDLSLVVCFFLSQIVHSILSRMYTVYHDGDLGYSFQS